MKTKPQVTEKDLGQDLKTHEALPAETKELELLQHQAEKTIGQENLAVHELIKSHDHGRAGSRDAPAAR